MGQAASRQEEFWEACGFGHWVNVRRFIDEGIDVNWRSLTHNSCAIHVASQGKPKVVELLLKAKCNIHVEDDRGNTALHHAAMKGHADILWMLLDAGCDPNAQDKNGWTPLICAAYYGYPEAVWTLLERGAFKHLKNKDDRTALHEVARSVSNDEELLEEITDFLIGADLDINDKSSSGTEADFTPLMFAAYHGHVGVASKLVKAKCDIHTSGAAGWTALHWAANRGHGDCVEFLLEAGADPTLKTQRGDFPLEVSKTNAIKNILAPRTPGYEDEEFDVALDIIPIPAVVLIHASEAEDEDSEDGQDGNPGSGGEPGTPVRVLITDRPSVTTDECSSSSASDSCLDDFEFSDFGNDDRDSTPENETRRLATIVAVATEGVASIELNSNNVATEEGVTKLAPKVSQSDSDFDADIDEYCDVLSTQSESDDMFQDALGPGTDF